MAQRRDSSMGESLPPASALLRQLNAITGRRSSTLAANLVQFAQLLKLAGFDVTSGRVIDSGRALLLLDLSRRDEVRQGLKACFLSDVEQTALFDQCFDLFWGNGLHATAALVAEERLEKTVTADPRKRQLGLVAAMPQPTVELQNENPAQSYSARDDLTSKDFSTFTSADVRRGRRIIRALAPKLASALSRRRRTAHSGGSVDLRRSMRNAVRHGGEIVDIYRTRRRVRNVRLVVLCDVSGSMDVYSRFLVQFLYALQNELRGVSTFVFSTRLNEVTHLLKTRSFDEALERIGAQVDSWSGGTSIGESLYTFELRYGRRRITSRTVMLIISDGWDRGDTALLSRAMQAFRRRAYKIIWLNPLLGHAEYRPLAKGMAAALPYTDYFLPVHNLDSLARLGRTLMRLARA
jgi:uncharacterized protein with von Willebrand factor type A (vWA) domain